MCHQLVTVSRWCLFHILNWIDSPLRSDRGVHICSTLHLPPVVAVVDVMVGSPSGFGKHRSVVSKDNGVQSDPFAHTAGIADSSHIPSRYGPFFRIAGTSV